MKKLLYIILSMAMVLSFSLTAFAETRTEISGQETIVTSTEAILDAVENIPVYVVYIQASDDESIEKAKESATQLINECEKQTSLEASAHSDGEEVFSSASSLYKIVEVSDSNLQQMVTNPLFLNTFSRVNELLESGAFVGSVKFYLPEAMGDVSSVLETASATATSNGDDEAAWEANTYYLGSYNGYKFRYVESSISIESKEVNTGNVTSSMKWPVILTKAIEVVANHYANDSLLANVVVASNDLAELLDYYEPPISLTFGASSGYHKSSVSGDLYIRTVFIKDIWDRMDGYAYYNWGSAERLRAALRVRAKWPYDTTEAGSHLYEYASYAYSKQDSANEGYYGSSAFYNNIISLYRNTSGYFTYDEEIDYYEIIASLLN